MTNEFNASYDLDRRLSPQSLIVARENGPYAARNGYKSRLDFTFSANWCDGGCCGCMGIVGYFLYYNYPSTRKGTAAGTRLAGGLMRKDVLGGAR